MTLKGRKRDGAPEPFSARPMRKVRGAEIIIKDGLLIVLVAMTEEDIATGRRVLERAFERAFGAGRLKKSKLKPWPNSKRATFFVRRDE